MRTGRTNSSKTSNDVKGYVVRKVLGLYHSLCFFQALHHIAAIERLVDQDIRFPGRIHHRSIRCLQYGPKDYGYGRAARVGFHLFNQAETAFARHHSIGYENVGWITVDYLDGVLSIGGGDQRVLRFPEKQA